MRRTEHDREDLLREATALIERAELTLPGCELPVVVGFRRDGSFSAFFGGDPVYQFNAAGELRRAFAGGLLYKAEQGRLIELRRQRSASETALIRRPLEAEEESAILSAARDQLHSLSGECTIMNQVPSHADILARVRQWLARLPAALAIASRPHASK